MIEDCLAKSIGHVGFHADKGGPTYEYYKCGEDYFRADVSTPIDTRGRRFGRFECTEAAWPLLLQILGGELNDGIID